MKKYNLSSYGFYVISIGGTCLMMLLTIFVFLANNSNLLARVVSVICLLFFVFALYLCLFNKISLKEEYLIIWNFKKIQIPRSEIKKIYTSENLLENIIYIETSDKTYKISGKTTLLGKRKNKYETNKIVKELYELII